MSKEAMKLAQELRALADRFSEGWYEGIKIDASDIVLLSDAAEALAEQPAPMAKPRKQEPVQRYSPDGEGGMEVDSLGAWMKFTSPPAQQEPCGWQFFQDGKWHNGMETNDHRANTEAAGVPVRDVYPSPQAQRTWVGLTDVEIASACKKHGGAEWWWRDIEEYGRAIEAKLKEKNA